jgi:LysR family transcriptional regulator, glycine cleavage system transcriptional activator
MASRLPPLATLQAFEAAVRHQSYTRAAEELALTHGAISHHVTVLEERLGRTLFSREKNQMRPTEHARLLAVQVRQALRLLERHFAVASAERTTLTVSVLSSFANRWLLPRLADFADTHPDIDLLLKTGANLASLDGSDADCAIRFGAGGWPGVQQVLLMPDELFPVCAPDYRGGALPATPEDLAACTLLRNPWIPWEPWLHAAGVPFGEPRQGTLFDDAMLLLEAASAGLGVALARRSLVERDLAAGRLVRLFAVAVPDTHSNFFVWRQEHSKLAAILRLRDWLLVQSAAGRG